MELATKQSKKIVWSHHNQSHQLRAKLQICPYKSNDLHMYLLALVKKDFFLYCFSKYIVNKIYINIFFPKLNYIGHSKMCVVTMCVSLTKYQQALILLKTQRKQIPDLKTRGPLLIRLNFGVH